MLSAPIAMALAEQRRTNLLGEAAAHRLARVRRSDRQPALDRRVWWLRLRRASSPSGVLAGQTVPGPLHLT